MVPMDRPSLGCGVRAKNQSHPLHGYRNSLPKRKRREGDQRTVRQVLLKWGEEARSQEPEWENGNHRTGNSGFWLLASTPRPHFPLAHFRDEAPLPGGGE